MSTPVSNPPLHQGRVRGSPHVEGQFAAYVYVPLKLAPSSPLYALLDKLTRRAKEIVPILHPIAIKEKQEDEEQRDAEIHISLTRPVFLRAHQREEFKMALRTVARAQQQSVKSHFLACVQSLDIIFIQIPRVIRNPG